MKIYACIIIAILAIAVWLYVVGNISKFEFPLIIVGCIFITFLTAYLVFMMGIIAYEQAEAYEQVEAGRNLNTTG